MNTPEELPEIVLDGQNLYRDETVTDLQAGTLRRLMPITIDGDPDSSRSTMYQGQATLMTQAGALPINFVIEAESLADAVAQFPERAKQGIRDTLEEIERMQREQQSSILVPGQGGGMGGPGAGGRGPSGGGFKLA